MDDSTVSFFTVFSLDKLFFSETYFWADGLLWTDVDEFEQFWTSFYAVAFKLIDYGSNFVFEYFFLHDASFTKTLGSLIYFLDIFVFFFLFELVVDKDFIEILILKEVSDELFEALADFEVGFVGGVFFFFFFLLNLNFLPPRVPGIYSKTFLFAYGLVSGVFGREFLRWLLFFRLLILRWACDD